MRGVTCRQDTGKQGQQQASVSTAQGDTRLTVTTVGAQARVARQWCCYGVAGTSLQPTRLFICCRCDVLQRSESACLLLLPSRQMLCCCCQAGIPRGMSHLQTSRRPAW